MHTVLHSHARILARKRIHTRWIAGSLDHKGQRRLHLDLGRLLAGEDGTLLQYVIVCEFVSVLEWRGEGARVGWKMLLLLLRDRIDGTVLL